MESVPSVGTALPGLCVHSEEGEAGAAAPQQPQHKGRPGPAQLTGSRGDITAATGHSEATPEAGLQAGAQRGLSVPLHGLRTPSVTPVATLNPRPGQLCRQTRVTGPPAGHRDGLEATGTRMTADMVGRPAGSLTSPAGSFGTGTGTLPGPEQIEEAGGGLDLSLFGKNLHQEPKRPGVGSSPQTGVETPDDGSFHGTLCFCGLHGGAGAALLPLGRNSCHRHWQRPETPQRPLRDARPRSSFVLWKCQALRPGPSPFRKL